MIEKKKLTQCKDVNNQKKRNIIPFYLFYLIRFSSFFIFICGERGKERERKNKKIKKK